MIVKVQLSLSTTAGARQMLVYNQDRSVQFEGDAPPDIVAKMGDRPKAFFEAALGKVGELVIYPDHQHPDQGW